VRQNNHIIQYYSRVGARDALSIEQPDKARLIGGQYGAVAGATQRVRANIGFYSTID
jgi:hypothetical protein